MLERTTIRRGLAGLLAAALLPVAALAQSMPAKLDQPVTITFYDYNLASAGIGADGTKKLLAEFAAANPNVKVNAVGVPSPDMTSRIQTDGAAGKLPDVAQVVFDSLAFVKDSLGAKALEDIVPADELKADFEGMSPNGLKLGVIEGKTYALPFTFSTPVLFYNADLFKAAGLDPDKPPRTWAAVEQAALQIQQKTGARGFAAGVVGAAASGFDWMLQSVILSNGGRTLSEDRKTLTFAEPPAVAAVGMLRRLHDVGVLDNLDSNSQIEAMSAGKLGMFLNTSALQRALIGGAQGKYELRSAPMPAFGDAPAVPTNSGSGLVVFSSDPAKQRAAWELMKFLTSKRGYTIITSEIGYLPLRTDIVNDPAYLADWVKAHPLVQPNLEQLGRLQPWVAYPGPSYRQVEKLMMDAMEQAVFGGADIGPTLKGAQEQAQGMLPN